MVLEKKMKIRKDYDNDGQQKVLIIKGSGELKTSWFITEENTWTCGAYLLCLNDNKDPSLSLFNIPKGWTDNSDSDAFLMMSASLGHPILTSYI